MPHKKADPSFLVPKQSSGISIEDGDGEVCIRPNNYFKSTAIKRLVEETVPNDPGAVELIEEAYSLRSKILHEGSTDTDLESKGRAVENIVRQIFEAKVKQYLIN